MVSKKDKIKIYDAVLYNGNFDLFKYRLEILSPFVENFIVVELVEDVDDISEIQKKFIFLNAWKSKIELIVISKKTLEEKNKPLKETFFESCIEVFESLSPNFEDIICFSESEEIPNYKIFDSFYENLNFEPIILRQTEFVFNLNYECFEKHMGTICCTYSHLIQNEPFLSSLELLKKDIISPHHYVIDNGYKLTLFKTEEEILSELGVDKETFLYNLGRQIYPLTFQQEEKKFFGDSKTIFEFSSENLKQNELSIQSSLKTAIVLNVKQKMIDNTICEYFDDVININFTYDYTLPKTNKIKCVETINIFIPPAKHYETDDFQLHFACNQVIKILKNKMFLGSHNLRLIPFVDELNFENSKDVIWGDFIENAEHTISSLIKNPSI